MKKIVQLILENRIARFMLARFATRVRRSANYRALFERLGVLQNPWLHNKGSEFKEVIEKFPVNFNFLLDHKCSNCKVGLISFSDDPVVQAFVSACEELSLDFVLIDVRDPDFENKIRNEVVAYYLVRYNHDTSFNRQIFDERVTSAVKFSGINVYPTLPEMDIYESKRRLAYFLKAKNIRHPKTDIFFTEEDALNHLNNCSYPVVFKTTNGSASKGVEILQSESQARRLVREIFRSYYLNKALTDFRDIDYGYVIFQEFVAEAREFRVIKIGESWFGHEKHKLSSQKFMSGSGLNLWTPPSIKLLNFCREIAIDCKFTTMCFDVFQDKSGCYLVNELQTWFGSYNPSQMYIDSVPGRYVYKNGQWNFEVGCFNKHQSVMLRLVDGLNKYL